MSFLLCQNTEAVPVSLVEYLLLLLLSRFSRVRLCATPQKEAHQTPSSLGFSRQEYWSGLPLPSPMQEREKGKGSHSVVSDSQGPRGLQPTRLLHPWDFPGKSISLWVFFVVHSLLTAVVFLLWRAQALGPAGFSSCGPWA